MKFSEAWNTFEKFSKHNHSKGTQNYYKGKKKYTLLFLGKYDVTEINRELIFDFWEFLKNRNPSISPNTLNKYKDVVTFILSNECGIELKVRKLPSIEIITEPLPDNIIRLVFKYYESLDRTPINMRNELMFHMLYDTGLRISELLNLDISNIDFDTSTILVRITKTKKERYTFFGSVTHMLLINYIQTCHIEEKLFLDFRTNKSLTVNSVETICIRLARSLGISISISPHKWRHTFGTKFQRKHENLEVTRRILGHAKISTTQRYLHLTRNDLHDVYFRSPHDRGNSNLTHGKKFDTRRGLNQSNKKSR